MSDIPKSPQSIGPMRPPRPLEKGKEGISKEKVPVSVPSAPASTTGLFQREVETVATEPSTRRTGDETGTEAETITNVEADIDGLTDQRGLVHKFFGFIVTDMDLKTLCKNYQKVKAFFVKVGAEMPEEIRENFEFPDGFPKGSPAYISDAQADELARLADQRVRQLRGRDERDYGALAYRDLALELMQYMSPEAIKNLRATNPTFRDLIEQRLVLTAEDLSDPETLKFARRSNQNLTIKVQSDDEVATIRKLMQNPDNANLFSRVEVLDMTGYYLVLDQDFVTQIGSHCPNLSILECSQIQSSITFSKGFENLTAFKCNSIVSLESPVDINFSAELHQLKSFSYGMTSNHHGKLIAINFDKGCPVESLSCGDTNVLVSLNMQELEDLESLVFTGSIDERATVNLPIEHSKLKLVAFDKAKIHDSTILKKLEDLQSDVEKANTPEHSVNQ